MSKTVKGSKKLKQTTTKTDLFAVKETENEDGVNSKKRAATLDSAS